MSACPKTWCAGRVEDHPAAGGATLHTVPVGPRGVQVEATDDGAPMIYVPDDRLFPEGTLSAVLARAVAADLALAADLVERITAP